MTLRYLAFALVALAVLLVSVAVHALVRHRRGLPLVTRRYVLHSLHSAIVGVLLAQPVLLLLVAAFIARDGGAALPRGGIHAPLYLRGGAALTGSVAQWAPGINDQGNSDSCGAWATTEALRLELTEMGKERDWPALSGWYTYALATGSTNPFNYTSLDQEAGALIAHGHLSLAADPSLVWPTAAMRAEARNPGLSWRYLDTTLRQTERAIDLGYAPILLVPIHGDFYNAFGADTTDLWGSGNYGTHFIIALAYRPGAILVQNSWGTEWGNQGRAWLSTSSWSQVIAVGLVAPGASTAWPNLHAIPRPKPQPSATATPRPRPTATPRPRPTATPQPRPIIHRMGYLRVTVSQYLRPKPATAPTSHVLVPRGATVKEWGAQPGHGWRHITWRGHAGYLLARNTRPL